jgi:hypothetical protein
MLIQKGYATPPNTLTYPYVDHVDMPRLSENSLSTLSHGEERKMDFMGSQILSQNWLELNSGLKWD